MSMDSWSAKHYFDQHMNIGNMYEPDYASKFFLNSFRFDTHYVS